MDISWYKENTAQQAELRRDYPAVADLINEFEQKLADEQKAAGYWMMQIYSLTSNLLTKNAALREEMGRLNGYYSPDRYHNDIEEARKQAAMECLKWMIQNRCISETQANNFCCNFELEG